MYEDTVHFSGTFTLIRMTIAVGTQLGMRWTRSSPARYVVVLNRSESMYGGDKGGAE